MGKAKLYRWIKDIFNRFGYDIMHLPTDHFHRRQLDLFNKYQIDLLFDVGANKGQFAKLIRTIGYKGRIISFEPIPEAFQFLYANLATDTLHEAVNNAIGNKVGEVELNISANSYSSSILDILPAHVESENNSIYVDKIKVPIVTIDSIIDNYYSSKDNLFIKIDTQGYEKQVFEGCLNSIDKICGFQMELSIVPLYIGESLMSDMINTLRNYGYTLRLIDGGHMNYTTGELLQVECVFFKDRA